MPLVKSISGIRGTIHPEDNEGLPKLPEEVRNKMGYMQSGRQVESDLVNKVIKQLKN